MSKNMKVPAFVEKYSEEVKSKDNTQKSFIEDIIMSRLVGMCPEFAEYVKNTDYEVSDICIIIKLNGISLHIYYKPENDSINFSVLSTGYSWYGFTSGLFLTSDCKKAIVEFFNKVRETYKR